MALIYRYVFFFKQKAAYEMRISDWSSDVCSSDLLAQLHARAYLPVALPDHRRGAEPHPEADENPGHPRRSRHQDRLPWQRRTEIGRASCRERVCQYV